MNEPIQAIILSLLAGITIPLGGVLARFEHIQADWLESEFRHSVIAFGGGALVAAVALVLVPHGMESFEAWPAVLLFLAGGAVMMLIDRKLQRNNTPASNLIAALSDFLPEALALGAVISGDFKSAVLLAGLIALQNLPEGFNAYREMIQSGKLSPRVILAGFFAAVLLGPIAALCGLIFLTGSGSILGAVTLLASGAILYLVFQDVAPQAKLEKHWAPALGALVGFAMGMAGKMLIS